MTRLMAIDYGERRIGVALTDPMQLIASPYETLQNNSSVFFFLSEIIKTKEISSVIVGVPFDQDNNLGKAALKVLNFVNELDTFLKNEDISVDFYEQDERYSTFDAYEVMRKTKTKNKKKKQLVDSLAALSILKNFMDSNYKTPFNFNMNLNAGLINPENK